MKKKDEEMKDIVGINKIIHEPARLMIMALLYVVESADFLFVMRQTNLTWGNLSSHMSKLEKAGYIEVEKEFLEKKPHTVLKLTSEGRGALREYSVSMRDMLKEFED